jgi:hypothetical protein
VGAMTVSYDALIIFYHIIISSTSWLTLDSIYSSTAEGQLGDGTFIDKEFAVVNIPNDDIVDILGSGASSQSVFFVASDKVYAAGANYRYQLGIGEIGSRTFPVEVDFDDLANTSGIDKISSSGSHTVSRNCPVRVSEQPTKQPSRKPSSKPTAKVRSSMQWSYVCMSNDSI